MKNYPGGKELNGIWGSLWEFGNLHSTQYLQDEDTQIYI